MIGVPALIDRAANNPIPLIGDLRFCHSRFRRCIRKRAFLLDFAITLFEIPVVLVRLDHVASFIVNANHGVM